ncbi:MAG: DUF4339 domain-containing protein [Pontiellaceae bacterium]|nr:DUF4339 domain-containing protein [Pontiellaceae bacterium]MBN2784881.1 DUF4339 domain-containing protein [Pontiellaceae bacterium]
MWYYIQNNERQGPVDENAVDELVAQEIITRQTLVWKEGMADWKPAVETELSTRFKEAPDIPAPAVPIPSESQKDEPYVPATYTPDSFRKYWLWLAWLQGIGYPLCLLFIGIIPLVAGAVLEYIMIYRLWTIIQDGKAQTSPGKAVGFLFIPFFNLYWAYVAYVGLAQDMNRFCENRNISGPRVSEGLALAYFILWICCSLLTLVPYIGFFAGIASVILTIILMKQYTDLGIEILKADRTEG